MQTEELRDEQRSCTCDVCSGACTYKPGWFLPGEAEKAAELMGMPFLAFFKKYLGVDWWNGDEYGLETFVLAPSLQHHSPGMEYPAVPQGVCIFFNNKRCAIHGAKPNECQQYWHGDDAAGERHKRVAEAWEEHQAQIEELLGCKPVAAMPDLGDMISMLGGNWSVLRKQRPRLVNQCYTNRSWPSSGACVASMSGHSPLVLVHRIGLKKE